jgi:16S rRNA (uracil1498-N3)-methyltransferase
VLRLRPGDPLALLDGEGRQYQGIIQTLEKDEAGIRLLDMRENAGESPIAIWLAQGIPKGDKMDWIIQKAAELGARGVIPLEMNRCVVRLGDGEKKEARRLRWQKVAREAVKQCGRSRAPDIGAPCGLEALTPRLRTGLCLIPWEEGGAPLKQWVQARAPAREQVLWLVIGPEGGIDAEEIACLRAAGGAAVTLGPRVLRTETAGIAALSVLQYEWGDLGGM